MLQLVGRSAFQRALAFPDLMTMRRNPLAVFRDLIPGPELREMLTDQKRESSDLREELRKMREGSQIFEKAFRVAGFIGDYVEFGSFGGDSLVQAYFASLRVLEENVSGVWDHAFDDPDATKCGFRYSWDQMRFIAFDSFQGIPESTGADALYPRFPKGSYACPEETFRGNLRRHGIADNKAPSLPGFFCDTLNHRPGIRSEPLVCDSYRFGSV
jgi:hypothetical protein